MRAVMLRHAEFTYKDLVLLNRVFHRNFIVFALRQTERWDLVVDGVRQINHGPESAGQDGFRPPLLCEQKQSEGKSTSDNKGLYFHLVTELIQAN